MAEESFKIRLRFPSGEEFEAEGNKEFIEQQKLYFLALIGKKKPTVSTEPAVVSRPTRTVYPLDKNPIGQKSNAEPFAPVSNSPALSIIPAAQRNEHSSHISVPETEKTNSFPALRLWERLLKEDGDIVLLRKKMKLSAQEAALLLLAGSRVLLKKPACTALDLARALKKSGFTEGRLDRLLLPDIKSGHLSCEGVKRSRVYRLTNEGFAKSFVLAEKLVAEMNSF